MDYFMSSQHDPLKRKRWEETAAFYPRFHDAGATTTSAPPPAPPPPHSHHHSQQLLLRPPPPRRKLLRFSALDDEMAAAAEPPVTVVLEGRSICHRIHLGDHDSYDSLAAALRGMFADVDVGAATPVTLSNAVPGHVVAYEDMEDDLLLAGDLSWKDFVRVVKRIRILPARSNRRKKATAATTSTGSARGATANS